MSFLSKKQKHLFDLFSKFNGKELECKLEQYNEELYCHKAFSGQSSAPTISSIDQYSIANFQDSHSLISYFLDRAPTVDEFKAIHKASLFNLEYWGAYINLLLKYPSSFSFSLFELDFSVEEILKNMDLNPKSILYETNTLPSPESLQEPPQEFSFSDIYNLANFYISHNARIEDIIMELPDYFFNQINFETLSVPLKPFIDWIYKAEKPDYQPCSPYKLNISKRISDLNNIPIFKDYWNIPENTLDFTNLRSKNIPSPNPHQSNILEEHLPFLTWGRHITLLINTPKFNTLIRSFYHVLSDFAHIKAEIESLEFKINYKKTKTPYNFFGCLFSSVSQFHPHIIDVLNQFNLPTVNSSIIPEYFDISSDEAFHLISKIPKTKTNLLLPSLLNFFSLQDDFPQKILESQHKKCAIKVLNTRLLTNEYLAPYLTIEEIDSLIKDSNITPKVLDVLVSKYPNYVGINAWIDHLYINDTMSSSKRYKLLRLHPKHLDNNVISWNNKTAMTNFCIQRNIAVKDYSALEPLRNFIKRNKNYYYNFVLATDALACNAFSLKLPVPFLSHYFLEWDIKTRIKFLNLWITNNKNKFERFPNLMHNGILKLLISDPQLINGIPEELKSQFQPYVNLLHKYPLTTATVE